MKRASSHRSRARFIARVLPGAKTGPFPGFIPPCLAATRKKPPAGDGWLHEIDAGGLRIQAHFHDGRATLLTAEGHDCTSHFLPNAKALAVLPANNILLDGEMIVMNKNGVADRRALQDDLAAGRNSRLVLYAFDLLYLDGFNIQTAPLIDRKRVLQEVLVSPPASISYGEHFVGDGAKIYAHACAAGLAGIVSKRADAPYRCGRSKDWVKVAARI